MKIVNFGSLNYDYVYFVDHIVLPEETISSTDLSVFCGGKGLNQSIALSHAGANRQNTKEFIDEVLASFSEGDYVLLQNEMNLPEYIIEQAYAKKMIIVLNPSPYNESLERCDLGKVSFFILNEVEGMQITGEKAVGKILTAMLLKYPSARIVLTLGKQGVIYADREKTSLHGIYDVEVVDTTAAGDTFTGYFIASDIAGKPVEESLRLASIASSLAVSKKGAVDSIPHLEKVLAAKLTELNQ